MTKKEAQKIGQHINSLLVWRACVKEEFAKPYSEQDANAVKLYMDWEKQAALALVDMGIPMAGYRTL